MNEWLNLDWSELSRHAQWTFLWIFLLAHFFVGFLVPNKAMRLPLLWRLFGDFSASLNNRLNRKKRSERARRVRGYIVMLLLMGIAFVMGTLIKCITYLPEAWAGLFILWVFSISFTAPLKTMKAVMQAVANKDIKNARHALQHVGVAETEKMDKYAVVRHVIEFSIWAMVRLFIGPVFWFVVAGGMGLGFYLVFAAAERAIGCQDDEGEAFAKAVIFVDAFLNWIPLRLTALLLWLASLSTPNSHPKKALANWMQADKVVEARDRLLPFVAGLTEVTLGGGYVAANGVKVKRPWFGDRKISAKVSEVNIQKILILYMILFAWSLLALLTLVFLT